MLGTHSQRHGRQLRRRRRHARAQAAPTPPTSTTRPCSSAPTTVRRRSSTSSSASPAASPPASRNIAAARGVTLRSVTADVEGDIDLQGILGLSDSVRNGYEQIRISFTIDADAPAEKVREIVEQSRARSAVFDVLTNGVPVTIDVNAA